VTARAGRVVGLDLGERRIGVAVSDAGQVVATGMTVIERPRVGAHRSAAVGAGAGGGAQAGAGGGAQAGAGGGAQAGGVGGAGSGFDAGAHAAVIDCLIEVQAVTVVVGLPLSLSGQIGPAAQGVLDEVERLRLAVAAAGLDVAVETHDERFTTVTAAAALRAGGRKSGSRRARADRRVVDQVAAAVMLQSWLDRQRSDR
jgi:putative transcription antitermination factor YqgF